MTRVMHNASLFFLYRFPYSRWKTKEINRIPARRGLGLWGSASRAKGYVFILLDRHMRLVQSVNEHLD
jgi:hypothetical protein